MLKEKQTEEIAKLAAQGYTVSQIAKRVDASIPTVRAYIKDPSRADGRRSRDTSMPLTCKLDQADRNTLIQAYKVADYNSTLLCDYIVKFPEKFGLPKGFTVAPRTVMYYMKRLVPRPTYLKEDVGHFECEAGQQLQIDFVRFQYTYDNENKPRDFFAFEAVYTWSHKIFYTICPDMTQASWLRAIARCIALHGIPKEILCDNDKSLVTSHPKTGEVVFNKEFLWFCKQYGIDPKACKPGRPQTKGMVEVAGKYLKKTGRAWIKLHRKVVNNIEELDDAIQEFTVDYTDARIFSAKNGDEEYEKLTVTQLFEIERQHLGKVPEDLDLNITAKLVIVDKSNLVYIHGVTVEMPVGFEESNVCVMVTVSGAYLVTNLDHVVLASGCIPNYNLLNFKFDEKPNEEDMVEASLSTPKLKEGQSTLTPEDHDMEQYRIINNSDDEDDLEGYRIL